MFFSLAIGQIFFWVNYSCHSSYIKKATARTDHIWNDNLNDYFFFNATYYDNIGTDVKEKTRLSILPNDFRKGALITKMADMSFNFNYGSVDMPLKQAIYRIRSYI